MHPLKSKAHDLIQEFKGDSYIFGIGCLPRTGEIISPYGKKTLLITSLDVRNPASYQTIRHSLEDQNVEVTGQTGSAGPNTPREDVIRMRDKILDCSPDSVLVASGGSGIDAAKAAVVLADLGGGFEDYFGTGMVTQALLTSGKKLRPCIAVQTASGSAAHLSKYSNVTDIHTHQKKLIVDDAIVPPKSLFDYSLTRSMSPEFTCDGSFDTMAHLLEVYYGSGPKTIDKLEEVALTGIELIFASLEKTLSSPDDEELRENLGLAADLGGYAIMIGGTNGGHLTSFSLVDILSHGRACASLNPSYTVFFAPAIQRHLHSLAELMSRYGLIRKTASLSGTDLGIAVAEGLTAFSRKVNFPTRLGEVEGMTPDHIDKALTAAKNPQLEMKLRNMPIPLSADQLDEFMGPILSAALTGDFSMIKSFSA